MTPDCVDPECSFAQTIARMNRNEMARNRITYRHAHVKGRIIGMWWGEPPSDRGNILHFADKHYMYWPDEVIEAKDVLVWGPDPEERDFLYETWKELMASDS